jgi:hypothetical protein
VAGKVERSEVVMVLDRYGVHGEAGAWISERVEVTPIGATYSVLQHPTGAGRSWPTLLDSTK